MVLQEGPIDGSLLTYQQSHRSHSIWANNGEPPVDSKHLKVRRIEGRLKKLDPPSPPVLQLIRQAGFGGVIDIPFISLDLGLMTALLERWRPETHSFHLRTGEWTVTLQDVEVLLGLPVDGEPIIGTTNEDWGPLCQRLLGIEPVNKADRKGGKVKMSWLREHFNGHLAAWYTEENVQQQAPGYILLLIGGVLMSDHSGSQVHLAYLTLLEDLTIVRSWGSACLSNLYHYLCHGCKSGKDRTMWVGHSFSYSYGLGSGFLLLLLDAWVRVSVHQVLLLVHGRMIIFTHRICQPMLLDIIDIILTCKGRMRYVFHKNYYLNTKSTNLCMIILVWSYCLYFICVGDLETVQ
ncbi:serine/threonine-protein phosphatase 7 long form homolog [Rhododendron vialii]|uniref:serine/threonine-protein phosphatase 7 long form homolog n=1 Tax=Rhododendron vialii TaxID=182163 RepID=UPI00265EA18E|nr:serine/threonine-protein phosphatase 7 long form homolog [Rhododendron vialii]